MSWCVSLWVYPVWYSLRFLDLTISFPMLGKFLTIISSNIFSDPFFFSSSSGSTIIQMLVHLMLSQRSLRLSSILCILFSLFCSLAVISTSLIFQLTYPFFCLSYSAIDSFSSIFYISNCVVHHCLFAL